MRKFCPPLLVSLLLLLGIIACALIPPAAVTPSPLPSETTAAALEASPTAMTPALPTATATPESEIPRLIKTLNFGLPAGNGYGPQLLALDSTHHRLYTFNQGLGAYSQSNTISIFDLQTQKFTGLIDLSNPKQGYPYTPMELQYDPYRSRLYAIWGDYNSEKNNSKLTIIDPKSGAIIKSIQDVEAVAVAPDRLFLVNDERLWAIDSRSFKELASREMEARLFNDIFVYNKELDRIYLGRGKPWEILAFDAETLESGPSGYAIQGDLLNAVIDPADGNLYLAVNEEGKTTLRRLDKELKPPAEAHEVNLQDSYGDFPMVVDDDSRSLYLGDGLYNDYRLLRFSLPDLQPQGGVPIPYRPDDLIRDPDTGLVYDAHSSDNGYLLAIEPGKGIRQTIPSALEAHDALADPDNNRLYVMDSGGVLHVLDLQDYKEQVSLQTAYSSLKSYEEGSGQLALDNSKQRLYISGKQPEVIDTVRLTITARLDTPGQLTPEPGGERLFLTPPCRCHMEECNILVLDAETFTGTQRLFGKSPEILSAPCPVSTALDDKNKLLYANMDNGVPGSNSGRYTTVFDVRDTPRQLFTEYEISQGKPALDSKNGRAFVPHVRIEEMSIKRLGLQSGTITRTLELGGAYGQLAYDEGRERLYVFRPPSVQVFDGDLDLLAEASFAGFFDYLTYDPQNRRLYAAGWNGELYVMSAGSGELVPPSVSSEELSSLVPRMVTAPDGTLFRARGTQLARSGDGGKTWQTIGRGLPSRFISALVISPDYGNDHTLLAGQAGPYGAGGLFRSTDGGDSWQPAARGLTDLVILEIAISPAFAHDATIYVATREGGVFRSQDRGDSWQGLTGSAFNAPGDTCQPRLAISPVYGQDSTVFISTCRLLISHDGGNAWSDTGLSGGKIYFSPDYARDRLVLLDGLWRSEDSGQTWQPSAAGLGPSLFSPITLLFSPDYAKEQTIYIVLEAPFDSPLTLQRSTDAGKTWQAPTSGLPEGFRVNSAALAADGKLVLQAEDGRQISVTPGSLQWGPTPFDISQTDILAFTAGSSGELYAMNNGLGLAVSRNEGRNWETLPYPARTNDSHAPYLAPAGSTLFAAVHTAIMRSDDGGAHWIYLDGVPMGFRVASLAASPDFAKDGILLAGGDDQRRRLIRSVDGGRTWQKVFEGSTVPESSAINQIAFSPHFAEDGLIVAWLQDGGLLRSTDRGLSWQLVNNANATEYGSSLSFSPDGKRLILAALYGHLYVSDDNGDHWSDWGERLPGIPGWNAAFLQVDEKLMLLAIDSGIYRSADGGDTWQESSAGLPVNQDSGKAEAVRDLAMSGGRLFAALRIGGIYVSDDQGRSWRNTSGETLAAPSPTAEPTALSTQAEADEITCSAPPAQFAGLWENRRSALGCPVVSPEKYQTTMVVQEFEGGAMFWRKDKSLIYVLPEGEAPLAFKDTWDSAMPAYACPQSAPSQTPPTPKSGFGLVWCREPAVRSALGAALTEEKAFDAPLQDFSDGVIFRNEKGATYILAFIGGQWEKLE